MSTPFVGICSFPKSGNTWMRHILAAHFFDSDIDCIPDVYQTSLNAAKPALINAIDSVKFYKTHDLKPREQMHGVSLRQRAFIYLYRHPLDVFLSQLNYLTVDDGGNRLVEGLHVKFESVEQLLDNGDIELFLDTFIIYGSLQPKFREASSWFDHVKTWTQAPSIAIGEQSAIPVYAIKYEEMVEQGPLALEPVRSLLGMSVEELSAAWDAASGRTKIDGKFFWKQKAGNYREMLPQKLIEKFARYHGNQVKTLGYTL